MIEIKNVRDIREKLKLHEIDGELLIDLVRTIIIFESEFGDSQINKIVLLEDNEGYEEPHPYPEVDEMVGSYNKKIYIVNDSGEGVVIYRKVGLMGA